MQTAGSNCQICHKAVVTAFEATWCVRCKTVMHLHCLSANGEICPACDQVIDRAEAHFVYSRKCPECFAPNDPPLDRCTKCGAWTRWENVESYRQFVIQMERSAGDNLKRGWLEIAAGLGCLILFMLIFYLTTVAPFLFLPGILLLACFSLIGDGVNRVRSGRRREKFE